MSAGYQDPQDVLIVGAGPAGIFCALGLIHQRPDLHITMVEQGLPIDKRSCPKHKVSKCVNCSPCRITTGFSGAGAFSDGKLSLSCDVGGDLPELIGKAYAQELIDLVDKIYLDFGADTHIEGVGHQKEVADIRRRAIQAGLQLVDCPIRHLGTEKAQELYTRIQEHLLEQGVTILFETECHEVIIEDDICKGVVATSRKDPQPRAIYAKEVIVATGRRGADWFEKMCVEHGIAHAPGPVDIGVRVEVRNEIMEEVNRVLYESKLIGYPMPYKNKVRTFCQNPGGFVSQENYEGGLAVVNGHSYKDLKSSNTNLAVLCSLAFKEPFDQPIAYAKKVGKLCNMLGAGHILVQRFGDVQCGRRSWPRDLMRSNITPTLPDAEAGDITAAIPMRPMVEIINFINAMDQVVPGFAGNETLLYAPELKFYSNKVSMDENLKANIQNLRCLGDSSGWTRGLMMASVMGYLASQKIVEDKF